MIAILGSKTDYTATTLLEYFGSQGVSSALFSGCGDVSITINQNSDGGSDVHLCAYDSGKDFAAIVNRFE
jgi:hypothetical protein